MLRRLIAFVSLLFFAMAAPARAQIANTASGTGTDRVLVTISSSAGDVSRSTLSVTIDGQPAEIHELAPAGGEQLVFAILLDVSGSMRDKQAFEKQSALELFRRLAVDRNLGYFGDFSDELYLNRKPASFDDAVKELKSIGNFRGGTALHDAVVEAAKVVGRAAAGTNNRRAVIVFSDGEDEVSRLNLNDAVARLQSEGVPVFCIGLLGTATAREKSTKELKTLSDSTGGFSILLTEPKEFQSALLAAIERQYWLTLALPPPDGKLHSLSVKSTDPKLRISAPLAVAVR